MNHKELNFRNPLNLNSSKGFAFPPIINTHSIHTQCRELLTDYRTLRFENGFFDNLVFLNDSIGYFNPKGTLHLFEIKFDTVTLVRLLRDASYNGHNFNRNLFIEGEELYSFAGSGLFSYSTALIKFNFNENEWFEIKIDNLPKSTYKVISSWNHNNKLFVVYQLYERENIFSYGYVDLSQMKYRELNYFSSANKKDLEIFGQGRIIYKSTDYEIRQVYSEDYPLYFLFNTKRSEFIKHSFLNNLPRINGKNFLFIKDSTLFYRNDIGHIDSALIASPSIFFEKNFHEYYMPQKVENTLFYNIAISTLISILIALLVYIFIRKKYAIIKEDNINDLIQNLEKLKGKILSKNELDDLLGISHMSYDSIKTQRSQKIKLINESNKVKISRIKNKDDKRFFDYFVE